MMTKVEVCQHSVDGTMFLSDYMARQHSPVHHEILLEVPLHSNCRTWATVLKKYQMAYH